jgi:hypothetical protein
MGWGRTLLLGDIGNRMDIEDTENDILELKRRLAASSRANMSQDEMIATLALENAQLKLYLAGLIRLLAGNGTISKQQLETMVETIDAEDGQIDGKYDGDIV